LLDRHKGYQSQYSRHAWQRLNKKGGQKPPFFDHPN